MGCKCKKGSCQKCKKCKGCACKCPIRQKRVRIGTGKPVGRPVQDVTARPTRGAGSTTAIYYGDDSDSNHSSDAEDLDMVGPSTPKHRRLQVATKKYDYDNITVDLCDLLGVDKAVAKNVPSATVREECASLLDLPGDSDKDYSQSRLVIFATHIVKAMCDKLLPNDGEGLYQAMIKGNKSRDRGKVETSVSAVLSALPQGSLQKQAIRAVVCNSIPLEELKNSTFGIGAKAFRIGRLHYQYLASGNDIINTVRTMSRYSKLTVQKAVDFILSPSNVKQLSWGTRQVEVSGEWKTFPQFTRLKVPEYMYREYLETYPDVAERLCRSSFRKVIEATTSYDQHARKAVDYTAGILLYDNLDYIEHALSVCVFNETAKERVKKIQLVLQAFLKYQFVDLHVGKGMITSHHYKYALESTTTQPMLTACFTDCDQCQIPFKTMHYLKKLAVGKPDVLTMMDHSVEKFKIYMGHLVRVMNQREEIQRVYDDMDSDECFMVMDYKMKFEPQHFREKTTDHYGKKGSFTMVYLLVFAVIQLDTH